MKKEDPNQNGQPYPGDDTIHNIVPVSGRYESWFMDYASYVILERAVPAIEDGLKPVQRRIMHALKEMDDGRFNKVANVIGSTMQYHPHGDASIGDAITNLGQKELVFDTQGNWGDVRTGDSAAAPRYIEVRLSKFALDVVYNPQTTEWQLTYDGRKKEPVALPVKFPLLLAQGVEGIAVGLSTKILPHNFCELIKACIDILMDKSPKIFPDFATGGTADFNEYNQGKRGGKVRIRSMIEVVDKKTLAVRDIPYSTTTTGLIESIIRANDKGKIKIKQVVDNTARDVEILITLASGQSPDIAIDALYAFTDCEISISPNACVIIDDKPKFLTVNEILKINAQQTLDLLKRELEIKKSELLEKLLFSSLEKIFIENRIYRDIEECETWEEVIETIDKGLEPYKEQFYREIARDDILRLTEIKIKRISKFDSFKADELMNKLGEELKETEHHLKNLVDFAIAYFNNLLSKYGKGRERKTEIKSFDTIKATIVAANNQKLYVNREEGFIGYGLKKDEFVGECSDIDDILVIRKDGVCKVSRITEKVFMGKDIMHVGVFKKSDERMVYNAIYTDGKTGRSYVKRFQVLAITREKEYNLTKGNSGSKMRYVSANPNGEAEVITIKLTSGCKARRKVFDFDFAELEIKGRGAGGNILTKYPVRKVELKSAGVSTLSGLDIWYDDTVGRLNRDSRGKLIGNFNSEDKILVIYKDGSYELTSFELTNRYEYEKIHLIAKFDPQKVISTVHYEGDSKHHYVKRFVIETTTDAKRFGFISESQGSKLVLVTTDNNPRVELSIVKGKGKNKSTETKVVGLNEIVDVKGWKAIGNKLSQYKVKKVKLVESVIEAEEKDQPSPQPPIQEDKVTEEPILQPDTKAKDTNAIKETVDDEKLKDQPGKKPIKLKKKKPKKDKDPGFGVGETIELDF